MKKYLFGIIAVVFAVASVAFTTEKKDKFEQKWFLYVGSTDLQFGDATDLSAAKTASNYQVQSSSTCEQSLEVELCEILAESDGGSPERPVITGTVETKIDNYFSSTSPVVDPNFIREKE